MDKIHFPDTPFPEKGYERKHNSDVSSSSSPKEIRGEPTLPSWESKPNTDVLEKARKILDDQVKEALYNLNKTSTQDTTKKRSDEHKECTAALQELTLLIQRLKSPNSIIQNRASKQWTDWEKRLQIDNKNHSDRSTTARIANAINKIGIANFAEQELLHIHNEKKYIYDITATSKNKTYGQKIIRRLDLILRSCGKEPYQKKSKHLTWDEGTEPPEDIEQAITEVTDLLENYPGFRNTKDRLSNLSKYITERSKETRKKPDLIQETTNLATGETNAQNTSNTLRSLSDSLDTTANEILPEVLEVRQADKEISPKELKNRAKHEVTDEVAEIINTTIEANNLTFKDTISSTRATSIANLKMNIVKNIENLCTHYHSEISDNQELNMLNVTKYDYLAAVIKEDKHKDAVNIAIENAAKHYTLDSSSFDN